MKVSAKQLVVASLVASFIVGAVPVSAFAKPGNGKSVTGKASVNELASGDVAILTGNPFRFVIGISSGIKGFFISDKLSKASFRLEVAGRRAGELRKLLDWASENEELLTLSLENYKSDLLDFETSLRGLKEGDLSEDTDGDISKMVNHLLTQLRFVDDVRDTFTSSADLATLEVIDETLAGSLRFIGTKLDAPDVFSARIARLVNQNADTATTIRVIGILANLIQEVAGTDEMESFVAAIADARETLIADLANAMREESAVSASASMKKAAPAVAVFGAPAEEVEALPTIAEIVDQLADETLKAELAALLQ